MFYLLLHGLRKFPFFSYFFAVYIKVFSIASAAFENCDHYKEITPGVLYTIYSPNYRDPYPAGTFCRYTGTVTVLLYSFNISFFLVIYE